MVNAFLPASATKNFGFRKHPKRLYQAIRDGFGHDEEVVTRENWREKCGLANPNIDLIPLNFFLYCTKGSKDDYVLHDTLVEFALTRPFDLQFAKLAVFAFHLANSGAWHGSEQWPAGAVAVWANTLIKQVWSRGDWQARELRKENILQFILANVVAKQSTAKKMRNNYHFMLRWSGHISRSTLEDVNYNSQWTIAAPQLFWDRKIFDGALTRSSVPDDYFDLFLREETYKLIRCGKDQGIAIARAAFRDYSSGRMASRFRLLDQVTTLTRAA